MNERRNSDRIAFPKLIVRETNGEYMFALRALNLSEEGVFLENKFCTSHQEPYSKIDFTLPNGKLLRGIIAKMVREESRGPIKGAAFEFVNISEMARMELKRYFFATSLRGTA